MCASNRKNGSGPTTLHTVRKRLEATESLRYKNLAEFVSDVRLACRNWATKVLPQTLRTKVFLSVAHDLIQCNKMLTAFQPEPGATTASKGLNVQFEERLRNVFPEHTFPEMKSPSAPNLVS